MNTNIFVPTKINVGFRRMLSVYSSYIWRALFKKWIFRKEVLLWHRKMMKELWN